MHSISTLIDEAGQALLPAHRVIAMNVHHQHVAQALGLFQITDTTDMRKEISVSADIKSAYA